jgi:hypothetical protein
MEARTPYYAPEAACLWCEDCAPEDARPTLGGETDSPSHCDECGVLLDEALTCDGVAYVEDALREHVRAHVFTRPDGGTLYAGSASVLDAWREHYGSGLDSRLVDVYDRTRSREAAAKSVLLVECESGYGRASGTDADGAHWLELGTDWPDMASECDTCGADVWTDGWQCMDGGEVVCSSHVLRPSDALAIAADWHGGQASALYALASTGYVASDTAWRVRLERSALDVPAKVRAERPGIVYGGRLPQPSREDARRSLDALAAWCDAMRTSGYAEAMRSVVDMLRRQSVDGTYASADALATDMAAKLRELGLRLP